MDDWKDVQLSSFHHTAIALRAVADQTSSPQPELALWVLAKGATAFVPVSGVPGGALGPFGMAVAPNGDVVVSFLGGGLAVGILDERTARFSTLHQSGTTGAPGSYPWSVMTQVPPDDHLRGIGSQIGAPARDGRP